MLEKYDKVLKNTPLSDKEINDLWIYEGNDELKYTPFAGKYFNKAMKAIYLNQNYIRKVTQIVKSIQGIYEGNFVEYKVTNKYSEGDAVRDNGVYYISIIDNNNNPFNDENAWYPYKTNLIQDKILLADRATNETYEIFMEDGSLKYQKIEV